MKSVLKWMLCTAASAGLIILFAHYPAVDVTAPADLPKLAAQQLSPAAEEAPMGDLPSENNRPQGFYLREFDGRLAVFESQSDTPLHVFNVSISTMSDYDRSALREGIYAQDLIVLRGLVEDYTS